MPSYRVTRVTVDQAALDGLVNHPDVDEDMKRRARNVLARQRALVPVDTGFLSSTLQIKRTARGYAIGSFGCDYAAYVELGWQHARSGKWIPGQPYIRPSMDAARH